MSIHAGSGGRCSALLCRRSGERSARRGTAYEAGNGLRGGERPARLGTACEAGNGLPGRERSVNWRTVCGVGNGTGGGEWATQGKRLETW